MNFDFHQQYKNYSNIELLKIVKRSNDYQKDAVVIATQILSDRQVTPLEIEFVDQYYLDIENSIKARKEKVDALKNKATDFFEPILQPNEKVEPSKWLNIFLLIIILQYAWSLFNTIKTLIGFFKCKFCRLDIFFLFEFLPLLYVPIIFYLLFKRKRWGWILLFADNLFAFIAGISQIYLFFKFQSLHQAGTTSFLLPIIIKAAFVFFLWRDSIVGHFNVTAELKKKTAAITTIGSLLFILIMFLMFGL